MRGFIFWLLFFQVSGLFGSSLLFAQDEKCTGKLSGEVHDSRHQVLVGVNVSLKGLNKGSSSDAKGLFTIQNICPGEYTLVIQYLGYQKREIEVLVQANDLNTDVKVELKETSIHLEEIAVVEEKLTLREQKSQTVATISDAELAANLGENIGNILQNINGVRSLKTGQNISKPIIHGLHSNRVLILNNGIRHEAQQWGVEHAPEIDPFLARQISVIKGAAAVEYGTEALGGVVLFEPGHLRQKPGIEGDVHLVGMSNTWGGALSTRLEGNLAQVKGLAARANFTYRRLGDARAPEYVLSNTGTRELNFSGAIGIHREQWGAEVFFSRFSTSLGILAAAHIGNTRDLFNSIERGEPAIIRDFSYDILNPRQEVAHNLLKNSLYWQISPKSTLNIRYAWQFNQRQEFDIRRGGRSNRPAILIELNTHTLDLSMKHSLANYWQWKWGINALYQDNYNDVGATGTQRLIPDYDRLDGSLFSFLRYIKETWEWEIGLRYEHRFLRSFQFDEDNNLLRPEKVFNNIAFNTGLIYRFQNNLIIRGNLGYTQRSPNVNELYSQGLHHGAAAIEEGNENLRPESAMKAISSIEWTSEKWRFNISPYWQHIQNYIYLNPEEIRLTIRGAFPVYSFEQRNTTFWGIDGEFAFSLLTNLEARLDMSVLRASERLIWIPPNRFRGGLFYQRTNWGKFKNVQLGVELVHEQRQNRAPEAIENIENIPENPAQSFDFAPSPAGFYLFNLRFGSELPLGFQGLHLYLSWDNLFNQAYRDYLNRYRYYAQEAGQNFSIRIQYNFSS